MRTVILLLVCAALISGQQTLQPVSLPDFAGTGSRVTLASSGITGTVRFCQLIAPAGNTGVVQVGDSLITTSRGMRMAPGSGMFLPPGPSTSQSGGGYVLNLAQQYVLIQSGDVLTVTCWR